MDVAIILFSRLNRAVRYGLFLDSTINRNCSFPGCELIDPPRPQGTSFLLGSVTFSGRVATEEPCVAVAVAVVVVVAVPIPVVPDDILPVLDGTAWGKLVAATTSDAPIVVADPAAFASSIAMLGADDDSPVVALWTLLVQIV